MRRSVAAEIRHGITVARAAILVLEGYSSWGRGTNYRLFEPKGTLARLAFGRTWRAHEHRRDRDERHGLYRH